MFTECQNLLQQGGIILWCLLALGVGLYAMLASTWFGLRQVKEIVATEVQNIFSTEGGGALENESGDNERTLIRDMAILELDRLAWVERRLPFIGVLAGAAPLAGLLGTVSGMLATFAGLATSSQAQPIDKISIGISEALITTQAGLLIALPATFFLVVLRRQTQVTHATLQQHLYHSLATIKSQSPIPEDYKQ